MKIPMKKQRFWREPFFHFTLIAVLIFVVDAWLRDRSDAAGAGEIVVTAGRIENLSAMFEKTWQRPPTDEELQGLVNTYIRDEALFREGVALGVDQDDNVIRRRVRQKVDFFVDELASPAEPEEADLQGWLDEQSENYAVPAVFTFVQIYLDPQQNGESIGARIDELLIELQAADTDIDISMLGDATLLRPAYVDYRADLVANSFGHSFAKQLEEAPVGQWSGPIESAYGVHLVYMEAMTPARIPELAEVRDEVARDWRREKREAAVAEFHEQAVARYEVTVEWPESSTASAGANE
jgi:hypothetical protein